MLYSDSMDSQHPRGITVERFDHVILYRKVEGGFALRSVEPDEFEGQVIDLYPRKREVRVAFEDWGDPRRDGTPRLRRVRVPLSHVEFVARDG